jgi:hypothetical protein
MGKLLPFPRQRFSTCLGSPAEERLTRASDRLDWYEKRERFSPGWSRALEDWAICVQEVGEIRIERRAGGKLTVVK